ncbi:hypothetical protein HGRIS_004551 [Hohenbuehelia grisea]|uniref:Uncharacterized protein n=1 Tax=Hohenbuehelia grisea TaxID=104357 RepID=A0ABR3JCM5_9AGAR
MATDTDALREDLLRALDLANDAVRSDSLDSNGDPFAAMEAYKESITLIAGVIVGLQRAAHAGGEPDSDTSGEIKRLQEIHDVYENRINVLKAVHGDAPRRASHL